MTGTRQPKWLYLYLLLAAGIITGAFGLVALLGWVLGLPLLASFGTDRMPMAPSTAMMFLLFGVAICLRARTPLSRRAFQISVALGWLVALVALPLFTLSCLNIHPAIEHPGLNPTSMVAGAATGHMSPVTACCFLLASLSFLATLSQSALRRWRVGLAFATAGLLLGMCLIFLLAYFFGTPLLYHGNFIPPALPTILAFNTLGLALLVLASRAGGLSSRAPDDGSRTAFHFILIFIALAVGIIAAGYGYWRNQERHYRAKVEQELAAIADLKVGELGQWREDRLSDAVIFFKNPSFAALVRRFFAQPADADAQRQLLDWLGKYPTSDDYDQFRLMDAQSVTRLSLPGGLTPASTHTVQAAAQALRSGQITIEDFYRHEHNQRVYLSVQIPIFDESDANRPLGVLVLRMDPTKYLYPFIQHWPTPSQTAETLLLRRDGNHTLFLNELRFHTNSALNLREPLDDVDCLEAQATLGREGIMEGTDYRGMPVMAAVRAIPDSPWLLIAKIDLAEVNAPLRDRLWQIVAMIGVLLFGAGAGVGLVWRQQRVRHYREQAQTAEQLRQSETRYRTLFDSSRDAIMTLEPPTWQFTSGNPVAVAMFGARDAEHFATLGPGELSPEQQPDGRASGEKAKEMIEAAMRDGSHFFEWTHRRVNGESFPATVLLSRMEADGKVFLQATVRDITEQKRAETALARLSRQYELLLCSTGEGIFGLDVEGRTTFANPAAVCLLGYATEEIVGHLQHTLIHHTRPDGTPYPQEDCPVYAALKDGETHHVDTDVFWRKDGTSFPVDYTSTPVRDEHGTVQGAVLIFRDITERQRAEKAVRAANKELAESRAFVQATMDSLQAHVCVVAEDGTLLAVNQAWRDFAAANPPISGNVGVGANYLAVCDAATGPDAEIAHAFATGIRAVMAGTRDRFEIEYPCHSPQQQRWFVGRVTRLIGETTRRVVVAHENITTRKQAEELVRAKNEELEGFTYAVSHDLRSPVVTIQTFLGHLEQDIPAQNAARVAADMNFMHTAASKMAQLLDELLKLSRVGHQVNPPVDVPLQGIVQEVLALVAGRIAQRGVQVTVTPEPVTLHGDRAHFTGVFQNLVDNACKFMGDQKAPRIEIGVKVRGAESVFFVRDNGGGIEPGQQAKLFGLFVRLNPQVEGTGMGLALVKRIVELYAGKIWVESEGIGKGTCFYFTLPGALKETEPHCRPLLRSGDIVEKPPTRRVGLHKENEGEKS